MHVSLSRYACIIRVSMVGMRSGGQLFGDAQEWFLCVFGMRLCMGDVCVQPSFVFRLILFPLQGPVLASSGVVADRGIVGATDCATDSGTAVRTRDRRVRETQVRD